MGVTMNKKYIGASFVMGALCLGLPAAVFAGDLQGAGAQDSTIAAVYDQNQENAKSAGIDTKNALLGLTQSKSLESSAPIIWFYDSHGNRAGYTVNSPDGRRRVRVDFVTQLTPSGQLSAIKDVKVTIINASTSKVIEILDLKDVNISSFAADRIEHFTQVQITKNSRTLVISVNDNRDNGQGQFPPDLSNTYIINLQNGKLVGSIEGKRAYQYTSLNTSETTLALVDDGRAYSSHSSPTISYLLVYDLGTGRLIKSQAVDTQGLVSLTSTGDNFILNYEIRGWSRNVRAQKEYDAKGRLVAERGLDSDGPISPYEKSYDTDGFMVRHSIWDDEARTHLRFTQVANHRKTHYVSAALSYTNNSDMTVKITHAVTGALVQQHTFPSATSLANFNQIRLKVGTRVARLTILDASSIEKNYDFDLETGDIIRIR